MKPSAYLILTDYFLADEAEPGDIAEWVAMHAGAVRPFKLEALRSKLSNLGFDVKVDAKPAEVVVPTEDDGEAALKELPEPEIYLDGWEMFITVDCTKQVELEEEHMELELVEKGSLLEVLKETQASPVARIELPHACDELVGWSLNNGILDVTLKLTPPGADFDEDDDESDDDEIIEVPDVSIDLSDDDEGEDGGIPIF